MQRLVINVTTQGDGAAETLRKFGLVARVKDGRALFTVPKNHLVIKAGDLTKSIVKRLGVRPEFGIIAGAGTMIMYRLNGRIGLPSKWRDGVQLLQSPATALLPEVTIVQVGLRVDHRSQMVIHDAWCVEQLLAGEAQPLRFEVAD